MARNKCGGPEDAQDSRAEQVKGSKDSQEDLPGSAGKKTVDKRRLERGILELLNKGRLVECDTSRERLGYDALTLGNELWSQSRRRRSAGVLGSPVRVNDESDAGTGGTRRGGPQSEVK